MKKDTPIFMNASGPVKKAYINGYEFGDKLLEGVYFECSVNEDGEIIVKPPDSKYLQGLDIDYWLNSAKSYLSDIIKNNENIYENPDGTGNVWFL